jgi:DNA-binding transcriptional LysR family regulator
MNWQAITFDWNQVRAFLATIEEGSLSAAARALNLTQPTLGRQVAALEEDLGVTLFERSGRQLLPTPVAMELAEHVRAMGEAATKLSLAASGQSLSIEGVVKVSATEMFAIHVLPGLVADLHKTHPGLVVEIIATNELSDLRRREADIAIRNADPSDPDMIARRIMDESGGLFATPDLIARCGPFNDLTDLADTPFIGFGSDDTMLSTLQQRGVPITKANIVARSENHLAHWELAKTGLGIGLNAWDMGARSPDMQHILQHELHFEFPVWLVAPRELKTSARVRVVFDALVARLGQQKARKTV